jgi:hypothetical protein
MTPALTSLEKKCLAVVNSCTDKKQLDAAQKYIELYFNRTKNIEGFRFLITALNSKIDALT